MAVVDCRKQLREDRAFCADVDFNGAGQLDLCRLIDVYLVAGLV